MCDKWEDKAIEAEYEEDEPVNLQLYSDHRRGDLDSYPIIAVCDDCAAELGRKATVTLIRDWPFGAGLTRRAGRGTRPRRSAVPALNRLHLPGLF